MKKALAMILAAIMCVSVLFACGGGGGTTTKAPEGSATTKASDEEKSAETGESTSEAVSSQDTAEESKSDEASSDTAEAKDEYWPEETYNAVIVYPVRQDNWAHQQQVIDHVAEITKRDLNINCEIKPMTYATMGKQLPLMLAAQEQIDNLITSSPQTDYEVGNILNLMDYIDILRPTLDLIGEDIIMSGLTNGKLLGIPYQQERTHRYGMAMRTDILEKAGYAKEDLRECDWDQATEIFAKVLEQNPDMVVMGGPNNSSPACNNQHTDALDDGYGVLDNYGQELKVTNFFESDMYKEAVSYMRKWYQAGYVQKDLAVSQDSYEALVKAGNTFGGCCPMKPDSQANKTDQCGYPMTIFYFRKDMMVSSSGAGWTIGGTAKDPVQAARLLNYTFTNREYNDTINWGVEGLDWVEIEENVADYPEGMSGANAGYHNSFGWTYPNMRIGHVWKGNDPNIYDVYKQWEEASYVTKAYGFHFDNTEWQDMISALDNVKSQYYYDIGSGSVEPEEKLAEFNKKLYDTGLQELMDEKQSQLDEWCKENNIQ